MEETDDPSERLLENSRFWIQKVLVPIVVFIGVGGNIVTVMVLTRRRMRCSTNIYLTALAIADIVYLLFVFTLSFSHYENIGDRKYALYWRFYGLSHWLCDAASNASVWLTVSFTVERYIAVCHPIKGKVFCTEGRAKTLIIIVTLICILTTASTTFEHQLALKESCLRNCTGDELKSMHQHQQVSGKSSAHNNTTIHYLPNHNIVVTNLKSSYYGTDHHPPTIIGNRLIGEIYSDLQPQIENLLPINCTTHPHIIYIPIYPAPPPPSNRTNPDNNANLIEQSKNERVPREQSVNLNDDETYMTTEAIVDVNVTGNETCCLIKHSIGTEPTTLGKNITYKSIMYWYSAIGFGLLPLVLIATFNCFLIQSVYKSQKARKHMTNCQEASLSNENRITVMLIGVVILFLTCQTPTASFLIYEYFHQSPNKSVENIKRVLGNIFNFLVNVNAASNFVLYCVLSKKYRTTFRSLFCDRRRNNQSQDTIVLTSTRNRNSQRFSSSCKNGLMRRNISEYQTPRNLETQSLTSIPRSKSLMTRAPGKAKSSDFNL